jgi:hypothetical protein
MVHDMLPHVVDHELSNIAPERCPFKFNLDFFIVELHNQGIEYF